MAKTHNVTKESAPKVKSPEAAPEKKSVAKSKSATVAQQDLSTSKDLKPAKADSKVKPQSPTIPEPKTDVAPKVAKSTAPKLDAAVEPVVKHAVTQSVPDKPQDQKWQEIRLILEKLKEETLREIRKSVKNGTEAVAAIEPGGDIYDQASSERDRELGLILGDREREKIHSIDESLLRIDEGEYGICEECDEDIPLGRLKAMPFTRHCVKCKSDLEKLQAQTKRVEEERAYREIPLGEEEES
ncbi:MAG: hypothetical protein HGB32_15600 [Geobacteraceae bacterium]|nr:hypothetical protein [Geobacteraceae bacterium]NTW81548.1 hypothetical protein [Geobacteraceae bacterium]